MSEIRLVDGWCGQPFVPGEGAERWVDVIETGARFHAAVASLAGRNGGFRFNVQSTAKFPEYGDLSKDVVIGGKAKGNVRWF